MTTQQKTYVWAAGIIIIVALVWIGNNKQSEQGSIKIGTIYNLSGVGVNTGQNSRQGTDMAIEEINSRGGVLGKKLEAVHEDNVGDDTKSALAAINKFEQSGIAFVIGTNWTPSGLAIAPVACSKNMVVISPTLGVAEFNETCDSLFNLWPHDDLLSKKLGSMIVEQGHKQVAILGSLQEWERTQAEAVRMGVENMGGTVVSYQLPQADQSDFRSEALKIKSSNPEAVVMTNYAYEGNGAKQLREVGVTAPFFSVLVDSQVIKSSQGAMEGAIAGTSLSPTQEFSQKFQSKYQQLPDIGADTSYDSIMLIAEAIEQTKSTDPMIVKKYIGALKTYDGASGHLTFDGKGGVTKDPLVVIVKDGKTVPYDPTK